MRYFREVLQSAEVLLAAAASALAVAALAPRGDAPPLAALARHHAVVPRQLDARLDRAAA